MLESLHADHLELPSPTARTSRTHGRWSHSAVQFPGHEAAIAAPASGNEEFSRKQVEDPMRAGDGFRTPACRWERDAETASAWILPAGRNSGGRISVANKPLLSHRTGDRWRAHEATAERPEIGHPALIIFSAAVEADRRHPSAMEGERIKRA